MQTRGTHVRWVAAVATTVALLGSAWLVHTEWTRLRNAFDTQARIVHRLLSQQMGQHEAVLATLALVPPTPDAAMPLTAVYPHIRRAHLQPHVQASEEARVDVGDESGLGAVEGAAPPTPTAPVLDATHWAKGQYSLTQLGALATVTLDIDLTYWPRPPEWPEASPDMPLSVSLSHRQQPFVLQPGRGGEWQLEATKSIASDVQPFAVHTRTTLSWAHVPWVPLAIWWLSVAAAAWGTLAWHAQRTERQRAQALLRLDQVSRLGTLAEVGAGVAHEINQPLTAVLANAQAAVRLLKDSPPDIGVLRQALDQTVQQAKRAADVVARLRRLLERPGERQPMRRMALADVVTQVLDLLAPTLRRLQVAPQVKAAAPVHVMADPIALEQIVHNLVQNALQALENVPAPERQLVLTLAHTPHHGVLTVVDTGTGIAPDLLPRLFEPFMSTRSDGLGLGLTLCETLAAHMGGRLRADHHLPRGALFELQLPLARGRVRT